MKKRQPNLKNPIVQHRQPEQEEEKVEKQPVEPLPPAKVYIKKPDQELVPPEKPNAAPESQCVQVPALNPEPQPTSETTTAPMGAILLVMPVIKHPDVPQFAILSHEGAWLHFATEQEAREKARNLAVLPGAGKVVIYKLTPWRIVREETKTRIEPALKRKRKA